MNPTEFADTLDAGLADLRAFTEARMKSRCTVRRKTGGTAIIDGLKVPVWAAIHVDLPVRLAGSRGGVASSRTVDAGGAQVQVAVREAHVPVTTTDLRDNDFIEMTAGESAGLTFRVIEATWQDQATARRLPIVATERPKEWT